MLVHLYCCFFLAANIIVNSQIVVFGAVSNKPCGRNVVYNAVYLHEMYNLHALCRTSIDVPPSKNQALCEYCTLVSKLEHCRYFN